MNKIGKNDAYYADFDLIRDLEALEQQLRRLADYPIHSLGDLKNWLQAERALEDQLDEALTGHKIDFYRDMNDPQVRYIYEMDMQQVEPLLVQYRAIYDNILQKCPFTLQLDAQYYGIMRKRRMKQANQISDDQQELLRKEQQLVNQYREIIGKLQVEWQGNQRSYAEMTALYDHPSRMVREQAWRATADTRAQIQLPLELLLDQLVAVRHEQALQAGFANYVEYNFYRKDREYTIEDCIQLHQSAAQHVVPVWDRLTASLQQQQDIAQYRPWDLEPSGLQAAPFVTEQQLLDGVERMLERTDVEVAKRFTNMRKYGLIDAESRIGKSPGAFCDPLPHTKQTYIFSNFAPSFYAILTLVHEMGHAECGYRQFAAGTFVQERYFREEIEELFSHSLELLTMDKLDEFYSEPDVYRNACRETLRRMLRLLINPVASDAFQHWMYTHPHHTAAQRQDKYIELNRMYLYHPVNVDGVEEGMATLWMESKHLFAYPLYSLEYAMAVLGAVQLYNVYRNDPQKGLKLFKDGASANFNGSIAEVYMEVGVTFDFAPETLRHASETIMRIIQELEVI